MLGAGVAAGEESRGVVRRGPGEPAPNEGHLCFQGVAALKLDRTESDFTAVRSFDKQAVREFRDANDGVENGTLIEVHGSAELARGDLHGAKMLGLGDLHDPCGADGGRLLVSNPQHDSHYNSGARVVPWRQGNDLVTKM